MANYKKIQNKNRMSSAYGKWYLKAVVKTSVGTNELAERIFVVCYGFVPQKNPQLPIKQKYNHTTMRGTKRLMK